jgi:hypothetical protein
MEMIKDQDKIIPKEVSRWRNLVSLVYPAILEENKDEQDKDKEEECVVKNIPVDHFMINLNFMGLDKIV